MDKEKILLDLVSVYIFIYLFINAQGLQSVNKVTYEINIAWKNIFIQLYYSQITSNKHKNNILIT